MEDNRSAPAHFTSPTPHPQQERVSECGTVLAHRESLAERAWHGLPGLGGPTHDLMVIEFALTAQWPFAQSWPPEWVVSDSRTFHDPDTRVERNCGICMLSARPAAA